MPGAGDPRVLAAVDEIVAALSLRPAQRQELLGFIASLEADFPKLPHVSFYAAATAAGVNYRATYRVAGYKTRTERLGRVGRIAYKRAGRISEVLQQVKARLMKPEEAHRLLYVDSTSIDRHIEKFEAVLKSKGSVPRYILTAMTRLRTCIQLAAWERLGDIKRDDLPRLIEKLQQYTDPNTKKKLHPSTINDYLAVLRQFTRWATPALLPIDPLTNTSGVKNIEKNRRRDLLIEELAEVCAASRVSTAGFKMKGADRAMLYLTGYATGLRANELRQLEIPWLKLDATPPYIAVPARIQKGVKNDLRQPLPMWFAAELKTWLSDRKTGRLFPDMPRDVMQYFDADRIAARELWVGAAAGDAERKQREQSDFLRRKTGDGELVFHSHRHAFATAVLATLDVKSAQALTRHSTAGMLLETYGHTRAAKAAEGVEKSIKSPGAGGSKS